MGYYCFFVFTNLRFHFLKINNLKTTSKLHSAARAVRLSGSTCGLLPFRFYVVFYVFNLRAAPRISERRRLFLTKTIDCSHLRNTIHNLLFTPNFVVLKKEKSPKVAHFSLFTNHPHVYHFNKHSISFVRFYFCRRCLFLCLFFSFVLIQKKQKIKPENQKRKNYLKAPFRSPSRSP